MFSPKEIATSTPARKLITHFLKKEISMHKAIPKSSGISKRIVGGAMVAAVVLLASSLTVSEMQNQPANATAGCATDWTLIGSVCELRVTSDRSVVLPASITTYDLLLVGGGGGGGGAGGIPNGGNAGGGGGGEVKLLTSQSLSGTLVIDVGAGGAGGPNDTSTAIPATPGLAGSSTLLSGALVASALAGGGGQ